MSLKVGMIILMESDIESAIEFYKKLGLHLNFHLKGKWAEFHIGQIKLGLAPTSIEPFDRHTGIVLETENLQEFQERLSSERINFLNEPVVALHGIMASVKDPSGNIIDIYQPTPEKVQDLAKKVSESK